MTQPRITLEARRWKAVEDRAADADGTFVYGVQTTGVYCRPSCPSRRPLRTNVLFFDDAEAAEAAGFRACQRCHPRGSSPAAKRLALVCRHIEEHLDEPGELTLARLSAVAGASPTHLQRTFVAALGLSPRDWANAARRRRLRGELRTAPSVTDAIYRAGFGAPSRVYECAGDHLGMTPRAFRRHGHGESITYALATTRWGRLLVAATDRGVCFLALGEDDAVLVDELKVEFRRANIAAIDPRRRPLFDAWTAALVAYLDGTEPRLDLPLDIKGTAFQCRVWQALLEIPRGTTTTYTRLAVALGQPSAVRAVARACATNPLALAIPCHRVLREDGSLAGYRWGIERKRALLELERSTLSMAPLPHAAPSVVAESEQ